MFGKIAQPYSGAEGIKVSGGKIIRLQKVLHPGILRSINTELWMLLEVRFNIVKIWQGFLTKYVDMSTCV